MFDFLTAARAVTSEIAGIASNRRNVSNSSGLTAVAVMPATAGG
jgi:hypothetical protein